MALVVMIDVTNIDVNKQMLNLRDNSYSRKQPTYEALVEIGDFMRSNTDQRQIMVFADNPLKYLIPSLDADMQTLIWRKERQAGISHDEQIERELDYNRFYADDLTLPELHDLIDKYNIQYFVLSSTFRKQLNALLEISPRISQRVNFGLIDVWVVTQ